MESFLVSRRDEDRSNPDGGWEIYAMHTEATNPTHLTDVLGASMMAFEPDHSSVFLHPEIIP